MSDQGEKTCPLCAEEMDLTDQQLKPCKCGYEICVWCWHQIIDMAEKDESEGRCPACRIPYDKEKIVGMRANCERLVSEMNVAKKLKSQKGKSKTLEGRKQLGSVRVIQRNLVYVVGLPLDFADEDLLQRREYFGQYGKVLKVSMSRTASGSIQQFPNSTCSVYITYSNEEEAVRCIQSAHGFVLDGRPLRACFGTTKFCHAWLRNVPCSNPDCLYLHEIGSQEDSFTKDEIISAYTRSRVQNITGSSNSMHRRSGNVLPPPVDEYCNNSSNSSGKPIAKTAITTNNSAINAKVSPPNSSSGRSAALPAGASWATRSSNNQPPTSTCSNSNGPLSQKPSTCNGFTALSIVVGSPSQVTSLHSDTGKKFGPNEESTISQDESKMKNLESVEKELNIDEKNDVSENSFASVHPSTLSINKQPYLPPSSKLPSNNVHIFDCSTMPAGTALGKDSFDARDRNLDNICSAMLSTSLHENQQMHNGYVEHIRDPSTLSAKAANTTEDCSTDVQSDFRLEKTIQVNPVDWHEIEDDLLSFNNQRMNDPQISTNRIPEFARVFHPPEHSFRSSPFIKADDLVSVNMDKQIVDRNRNLIVSTSNIPSGHSENILTSAEVNDVKYFNLFPSNEKRSIPGRYDNEIAKGAVDVGESNIISNILSMDFDSWDESLASPQNLAKLLGETDKQQGSFGVPGSRKIQNSNQSRFLFAREEEHMRQVSDFGQSFDYFDQASKQRPFGHDNSYSNSLHLEKFVTRNGFPVFNSTEPDIFASSHSHISPNKNSVSRSQISTPPGFSVPSRAPPPGFTSHERTEQIFDTLPANHMLDASSLLRNQYQTPSMGSTFTNGDIEFMDPAILAVGKGTVSGGVNYTGLDVRSTFSPQLSAYEEAKFQSFLQRSLPPQQNQRFNDMGDNFSPLVSPYGIASRVMEQKLANNLSPFSQFTFPQSRNGITSNGQWDGWNEIQGGNNLGMAEVLINDRLGFNKLYGGYEDKIRRPSSGNLYNGTYGI
ncbi:hypothetical protein ACJIZ3_012627 [Penstemon smallii]|uniref:CCR4-NOT transcription complex subunit 4 n=1 Tax=Penstemon smallii TaxID=265156 RepID=A0ABD3UMY3_9LAMI